MLDLDRTDGGRATSAAGVAVHPARRGYAAFGPPRGWVPWPWRAPARFLGLPRLDWVAGPFASGVIFLLDQPCADKLGAEAVTQRREQTVPWL